MKGILCVLAAAFAATGFGDVARDADEMITNKSVVAVLSSYSYGVTEITSPLTNFPIAVSYAAVTNGTELALLTNLVETSNLAQGDTLFFWSNGGYLQFELQGDKTWRGLPDVATDTTPDAATQRAALGAGAWLRRLGANTRGDQRIILHGQVPTGTVQMVIAGGAAATNGWSASAKTLIAIPFSERVNLNQEGLVDWGSNPSVKDRIRYFDATTGEAFVYRWNKTGKNWYYVTNGVTETVCPIGNGCAAWYERAAGQGGFTVTWQLDQINPPSGN